MRVRWMKPVYAFNQISLTVLVEWIKGGGYVPAFDVAYANWPELVPFMTPEIEAMLTTEGE